MLSIGSKDHFPHSSNVSIVFLGQVVEQNRDSFMRAWISGSMFKHSVVNALLRFAIGSFDKEVGLHWKDAQLGSEA